MYVTRPNSGKSLKRHDKTLLLTRETKGIISFKSVFIL